MSSQYEIGMRLKELRERFGLTQRDLARHFAGTGSLRAAQTRITNWETGRYVPSVTYLLQIADIFQVSLDWLITGAEVGRRLKTSSLPLLERIPEDPQDSVQNFLQEAHLVDVPQELILRGAEYLILAQENTIGNIFFRSGDYLAIKPIKESGLPRYRETKDSKRFFFRTPYISLLLWEEDKFKGMFVLHGCRGEGKQIIIRPSLAFSSSFEDRRSLSPLEDVCTRYELLGQVVGWIHFEKV
jgi:transcriptional regulator with XRE-family HTH domain